MVQIAETENILNKALNAIDEKNYQEARNILNSAYEMSRVDKFNEGLSISMSLLAFINYSENN
jgi:hypothetical protein